MKPGRDALIMMFTSGGPVSSAAMLDVIAREPECCSFVDKGTGNTALHFTCCNGAPLPIVKASQPCRQEDGKNGEDGGKKRIHSN